MAEKAEKKEERPTRPFSDKLIPSGLGRRFFAIVVDIALFLVPSYLIGSYGTIPAYTMRDGGSWAKLQEAYALMEDTQLFALTKNGNDYSGTNYYYLSDTGNSVTPGQASYSTASDSSLSPDPSGDAYLFYHDVVWNYYTVFLPKGLEGGEYYDTGKIITYMDANAQFFTSVEQYRSFYYQTIMGLPTPETFNATVGEDKRNALSEGYFTYAVDAEGNADLTVKAVLKSSYQQEVNQRISTTLSSLKNYFFDSSSGSSATGIYAEACNNFIGSSSSTKGQLQTYYSTISGIFSSESMVAFMFIYFPLLFIVELIVPMCDKYGRTVGKWIFGLRVCRLLDSGEGIKMKWWLNLSRGLYMVAILSPLGLFTIAPMAIGFLFMISYFVLLVGKRHQSVHDMFLHTVVVNKKDSKIYNNEEEIYDEKMEELAKERANLYRPPEILDLSTINAARELANKYERFDDIENEDVEVKTYTEYKKPDPEEEKKNNPESDYFDEVDDDDENYEDPLGLGDVGPQKKIDPEQVNLKKDDDE